MGKLVKVQLTSQFTQVPNQTAQKPEKEISLQALGLLVNIMSYPETWELHKTELYKRYEKNKRTSVKNAWNELVEADYIIECRIRDGKKWDYNYFVRLEPFTDNEKEQLKKEVEAQTTDDNPVFWDVDFGHPKMDSSKSTPNKYFTNTKSTKEKNISMYVGSDTQPHSEKQNMENKNVVDRFAENYKLTGYAKGKLTDLLESYGSLLVSEALERAIKSESDKPVAYISGVLRKWSQANVQSLEDIDRYESEFKQKQKTTKKNRKKPNKLKQPQQPLPESIVKQQLEQAEQQVAATQEPGSNMTKEEMEQKQKQIEIKLKAMNESLHAWMNQENQK